MEFYRQIIDIKIVVLKCNNICITQINTLLTMIFSTRD